MRLVLFYLILVVAQGFFASVLSPVPAPDFFLLAVLTLLWRIQPWQLVLVAYGVGMLQDVMGSGVLGAHAFALAAGALTGSMVRAQLSNTGILERMLVIFVASLGKWAVMTGVIVWLAGNAHGLGRTLMVGVAESILTVAAGLLVLPWSAALLERSRVLQKELL